MNDKAKKALRNLKVGGIYTPIAFGLIFIFIPLFLNFIDSSGQLKKQFNDLPFYNMSGVGAFLIFWGINTLIYFHRFVKAMNSQ